MPLCNRAFLATAWCPNFANILIRNRWKSTSGLCKIFPGGHAPRPQRIDSSCAPLPPFEQPWIRHCNNSKGRFGCQFSSPHETTKEEHKRMAFTTKAGMKRSLLWRGKMKRMKKTNKMKTRPK